MSVLKQVPLENPRQLISSSDSCTEPEKLIAAVHLLLATSDPVARSLANAPIDDEPISEEEMRAFEASREWLKDHEPISQEEMLTEFGLTVEDFERMGRTPLDPHGSAR